MKILLIQLQTQRECRFSARHIRGRLARWIAFGVLLSFIGAAGLANAQTLKMLVPSNPGGGWDQAGRNLAAAMLADGMVKAVQIDNKAGAGGTIALAQFASSSKGDPNAVMIGGLVMVGAIALNKSPLQLAMVTPIARLTTEYEVIVVPQSSPYKTLADLLLAFKADPGKVSWSGGSAGGADHILLGLIAQKLGMDPARINYVAFGGGGEAQNAVFGGHVSAGVAGLGEFLPHIKAGRMRALAVSSAAGVEGIPSLKEQSIDVELGNWRGIFGAPGLSTDQSERLAGIVRSAMQRPHWKEALKKYDWQDAQMFGVEFQTFVRQEVPRVGKLIDSLQLSGR